MGSRSLVADKRECGAWEIGNLTAGIASWASEFCEFSWLDFFLRFSFFCVARIGRWHMVYAYGRDNDGDCSGDLGRLRVPDKCELQVANKRGH